jgi:hypothetical protein
LAISLGKERISASELQALLSGSTTSGTTDKGSEIHVFYRRDGRMSGYAHSKHYDVGTWEITSDDRLCRHWTTWRNGLKGCFDIYRVGEGQFQMISSHPRYEATFVVRNGDPEGLEGRIEPVDIVEEKGPKSGIQAEGVPK